jgi:serine/threonine protein kinase
MLSSPCYWIVFIFICQEDRVWAATNHPNIVPFFGISLDFDRPNVLCLVSPYYHHGSIISHVKGHLDVEKLPLVGYTLFWQKFAHLTSAQVVQIAGALSYLHDQSIIHGNLKGVGAS